MFTSSWKWPRRTSTQDPAARGRLHLCHQPPALRSVFPKDWVGRQQRAARTGGGGGQGGRGHRNVSALPVPVESAPGSHQISSCCPRTIRCRANGQARHESQQAGRSRGAKQGGTSRRWRVVHARSRRWAGSSLVVDERLDVSSARTRSSRTARACWRGMRGMCRAPASTQGAFRGQMGPCSDRHPGAQRSGSGSGSYTPPGSRAFGTACTAPACLDPAAWSCLPSILLSLQAGL